MNPIQIALNAFTAARQGSEARVERDKVDLLVKGFRLAIASTIAGPVLTAWLFQDYIGPWFAWGPAAVVYLLHLERYFFLKRFDLARSSASFTPAPWLDGVTWRLGIMGSVLALWNIPTVASGSDTAMFYSITLTAVMCAGALTQFCVYTPALWALVTPFLLGITLQLLVHASHSTLVSAVFLGVLWITLVMAGQRFSIVMHRDLEQRYRNADLVAELSAQKNVAEAASQAKSRFLAAASHDLRQPVHAVALLASALQAHSTDDGQKALLARLQGGVEHFSDVVDEILDIARLDANVVAINMQAVPIQGMLDRADATYREVASAKGIGLLIRPAGLEGAMVHADSALLWRVISNLVGNAVRYTPRGNVLLAVRREGGSSVEGGQCPLRWRIEVRDSGPGIASEQQSLIFEEFFQLHNPQRSSDQGLGLGLAVARRMAAMMGLEIGLRSEVGNGSVFWVSCSAVDPVGHTVSTDDETQTTQQTAPITQLRVMVVDDDERSREAMGALLGSWGIQPELAATGAAAASIILDKGFTPDVLLTDHWLADGEDAFSVAKKVMHARRSQAVPLQVAVFTGDMSLSTEAAVSAKGWHFSPKPVRALALRMWLEMLVAKEPL